MCLYRYRHEVLILDTNVPVSCKKHTHTHTHTHTHIVGGHCYILNAAASKICHYSLVAANVCSELRTVHFAPTALLFELEKWEPVQQQQTQLCVTVCRLKAGMLYATLMQSTANQAPHLRSTTPQNHSLFILLSSHTVCKPP